MTSGAQPRPTPVREDEPLVLRLRVSHPGGADGDVVVEADPSVTVGRVLDEIGACLGAGIAPGEIDGRSARLGRDLDRSVQVAACELVHGDRIRLHGGDGGGAGIPEPAEREVELAALLRVRHADLTEREVRLPAGVHVVGRGDGCAVVLDDPEVSRVHMSVSVDADGVTVKDLKSRNGVRVDGRRIREPLLLAPEQDVQLGQTHVELAELRRPRALPAAGGVVAFNRPPRVAQRPLGASPLVAAPPSAPPRSRVPLSASLAPLVLGIAMYLITGSVATLLFLALSPIIAVWSLVEDRRGGRRDHKRAAARWRISLAELVTSAAGMRGMEAERRRADAPSLDVIRDLAVTRAPELWLRRPAHDDFLRLRLGTADLASLVQPVVEPGGDEHLRAEAEAVLQAGRTLAGVPATLSLSRVDVVGACGPAAAVGGLARSLIVQAATLHAPSDLAIAAALSEDSVDDWQWLKWLPHCAEQEGGPTPLALGLGESVALLQSVVARIERRIAESEQRFGPSAASAPRLMLLLDERLGLPRDTVTSILERAGAGGVVAIWLGREATDLPGACRAIASFDATGAILELSDVDSGDVIAPIAAEAISVADAEGVALALAPLRETDARNADASIPRRLRLPPLLGIDKVTTDDVVALWAAGPNELSAPLGRTAREPFMLDLQRDGPHALVAGTTGSGKSELLQTMVATLAATHSPEHLTLLLIDYKGGAAFKDCVDLPHTVGFFTDLDANLANRALVSLGAELRRREEILRAHGAKDLIDLARRGAPAPANLLIVVDEFATLVTEVPQFVDGIVNVAQRGRSLGVHLVLATQKAAGTIGPNVRANTNLRIALRVQDTTDSEDVIGSGDAARIPPSYKGRAIARIGLGDAVEFQTAFVGAHSTAARTGDRLAVRRFRYGGPPPRPAETIIGAGPTDLERIVAAAGEAAERLRVPPQPSPWLPPLPAHLGLDELEAERDASPGTVTLGLLDEPAAQRRSALRVDLDAQGSLLFYGSGGSGKSTALRTLAVALARTHSPEDLHIYALDFANGGLRGLEGLPHCGAVILKDESERVERLVRRLTETLAERKSRPGGFWPRVAVLLDDYAGFDAAYERVNAGETIETLHRIVAEGRALGVHFAITAGQRSAVPMQLSGLVPWRFILEMASDEEYGVFGISPKLIPADGLAPGRGFLDARTEGQIAVLGEDGSASGQLAALRAEAEALSARYDGEAPGIGVLPASVALADLPPAPAPLAATLGVGDRDLGPVAVGLEEGHLLVLGPYRSGRSTALATIATGLSSAELHLLAPRRSPLVDLDLWESVSEGVDACTATAERVREALASRTNDARPLVLVVDNGEEVTEAGPAQALEVIARGGRDRAVRIVAAVERNAARRAFGGWVLEMRKEELGLLLDPDPDLDGDMLGARLPRGISRGLPAGRGYLVERGTVELVQVAVPER